MEKHLVPELGSRSELTTEIQDLAKCEDLGLSGTRCSHLPQGSYYRHLEQPDLINARSLIQIWIDYLHPDLRRQIVDSGLD